MDTSSNCILQLGRNAKDASYQLATAGTRAKNDALLAIADELADSHELVLAGNALDMEAGRAAGKIDSLLDRMLLDPDRLQALEADLRSVVRLPDPVGEDMQGKLLGNGLRLTYRRIPIGVIGVIYEARPNVTLDIASLCLKTGNAVILRGGSDIRHSNKALMQVIHAGLEKAGLDVRAIQSIEDTDRTHVTSLLRMDEYVDMIIPRGGGSLHALCRDQASMPVITGGVGICHYFVDETADQEGSLTVIENAKTSRPSVCNSLDTLLVHRSIASEFIPKVVDHMAACNVDMKLTEDAMATLNGHGANGRVAAAGPEDFGTEWMDLILGIKVVDSMEAAIEHIRDHSLDHSDGILTNDMMNARRFVAAVNSSAVFVNASTRFNDGGQFGMGSEVAVSTQKLHARGPLGLEALTSFKWIVEGDMHIRV